MRYVFKNLCVKFHIFISWYYGDTAVRAQGFCWVQLLVNRKVRYATRSKLQIKHGVEMYNRSCTQQNGDNL